MKTFPSFLIILHLILFVLISSSLSFAQNPPSVAIDWQTYMSKRDIVFNSIGKDWNSGVFTGNGWLGTMTYQGSASNIIRIDIGRTDLHDHIDSIDHLFGKARLPIGYFTINTVGTTVSNSSSRVVVWDAENTGKIVTNQGTINWRIITLSQKNIILLEANTTGNENGFTFKFNPATSQSPRNVFYPSQAPAGYKANPKATNDTLKNGVKFCWQPMTAGGGYATAWKLDSTLNLKRYFITVGYSQNSNDDAVDQAVNIINETVAMDVNSLITTHQTWWHNYYQQSFLSIPDNKVQNFYWAQLYKLGSAMHPGGPAVDLMGPWSVTSTPWPVYWNNLNTELAYSPLFKSNHLELSSTLMNMIDNNVENLKNNVPAAYQYNSIGMARSCAMDMINPIYVTPNTTSSVSGSSYELGDFTWLLHSYWQQYKYSMDTSIMNKLIPLLTKSINYYINVMTKQSDGLYHLPYTYSPEYATTRDCNYDLSLLRWGLMTLLDLDKTSAQRAQWQEILTNLVPYQADGNVLRIGKDIALTSSHRHYSHLLMIYPLQILSYENPANKPLIEESIAHWQSMTDQLLGYSYTGSSSMYSLMGLGNNAYTQLMKFINGYAKPNTFYTESGPVIETPLACATSILDFIMQSRHDTIYAFHGMPDNWDNASFNDLLAEGAFKVGGVYKNSKAKWVHIMSQAGGICNVNVAKATGKLKAIGDIQTSDLTYVSDTVVSFTLPQGKQAWLYVNDSDLTTLVPSVDPSDSIIDITDNGGIITGQYPPANSNGVEVVGNLIDNSSSTKYYVGYPSVWIKYQSTVSAIVDSFAITSANDVPTRDPKNWTLYGSNTGNDNDWSAIDTRNNITFTARNQTKSFGFSNTTPYVYYKLDITANSGATGTQLSEIALIGKPVDNTTPIILANFNAAVLDSYVKLSWSTLTEVNNNHFTIEHSLNGKSFEKIGEINGNNNSSVKHDYTFIDVNPAAGRNYYRLVQIDNDGTQTTSEIKFVDFIKKDILISLFPNPVNSNVINLKINNNDEENLLISITDLKGKSILKTKIETVNKTEIYPIQFNQKLNPGLYIITVKSKEFLKSLKFMVH